ncbi:dapper homolog 1 isoform X1 [Polypterus senegalus]
MDGEPERLRSRERLEASLAGLGELEYLRRRQELLVRSALRLQERSYPSPQDKLLEENISLLKKQLNCLRKRDAGLLMQLQDLDRQISELRLDSEKPSDHIEADSRPSSGFYELSDGASGSLSNSSNSVFSECLSSCHSSTCFCSPLEASLSIPDGQPKCADDLMVWTECADGHCQDQHLGTGRRSASVPVVDGSSDVQIKYQCDLISRNGIDVYRYPSPLHAVAVQSPMFFQSLVGHFRDEALQLRGNDSAKGDPTAVLQSPFSPPTKRLESYILGLLQKRAQPMRTNKPRTSINADPAKGILRQGSVCAKQATGGPQVKAARTNCTRTADCGVQASPGKQWLAEANVELRHPAACPCPPDQRGASGSLPKKRAPGVTKGLPLGGTGEVSQTHVLASPKDTVRRHSAKAEENKGTASPKKGLMLPAVDERPILELRSEGSSSQSLEEGSRHMVSAHYVPAQKQVVKLRKGLRAVKVVKTRSATGRGKAQANVAPEASREKSRTANVKYRLPSEAPKKSSSKTKRNGSSPNDGGPPVRHSKHAGHSRDVVLTKPRYKRSDYRRYKTLGDSSYDEALRRARRRHKREAAGQLSTLYVPSKLPYRSPYAYTGSDSEYSAECASLFHSTVLDTSEDEQSNYTTNRFGDSESSVDEADFVRDSSSSGDSEESGGLVWPQFGQAPTGPPQAEAFVKIKASHNLKKKILRFRSGSLKLMTTV